MMRKVAPRSVGIDTDRGFLPNLPPPYTFTGARPEQTRYVKHESEPNHQPEWLHNSSRFIPPDLDVRRKSIQTHV